MSLTAVATAFDHGRCQWLQACFIEDALVGVLVEVPVMLSLVAIANRNRRLLPE